VRPAQQQARSRTGWQPDPRASLALAGCASLLLAAAFIALLNSPMRWQQDMKAEQVRESLLLESPVSHSTVSKQRLPMPAPAALRSLPDVRLPLREIAPVSLPAGEVLQDYLDDRQQGMVAQLKPKVTASGLTEALQAPPITMPALGEEQGFRSVDGERIVKMGDDCGEIHTVQASSSPTNRVDIAMPLACPGTHEPTMGERLLAWAEKASSPP